MNDGEVLRQVKWRWLALALLGGVTPLWADLVRLPQGGEVRGEFAPQDPQNRSGLTVETLDGIRVTVAQSDVVFAKARARGQEEYESRRRGLDGSVAAHWQLAEWCLTLRMYPEREEQLQAILALDPDHADARRILGYQNYNGRWMTRDEFMVSQGYVQHQGKWMTPQERDIREKTATQRAAEGEWYPKVRLWIGWLHGNNQQQQQAALAEFQKLQNPDAMAALRTVMESDRDSRVRRLYVEVLGQFPGHVGVPGMVNRLLWDTDLEVRHIARRTLKPDQYPVALPILLKGLQSTENVVVNRAAMVLGEMGQAEAIPHLIQALVTTHTVTREVPVNNAIGFATNGQGGMTSQSSLPPNVEMMLRAGQLPYGVQVDQPAQYQRTQLVRTRVDLTNAPVLDALRKLSGQDLGFNERNWQLWWSLQKT